VIFQSVQKLDNYLPVFHTVVHTLENNVLKNSSGEKSMKVHEWFKAA